jgi:hypothetical protein
VRLGFVVAPDATDVLPLGTGLGLTAVTILFVSVGLGRATVSEGDSERE